MVRDLYILRHSMKHITDWKLSVLTKKNEFFKIIFEEFILLTKTKPPPASVDF
jgi:hypothetical protein